MLKGRMDSALISFPAIYVRFVWTTCEPSTTTMASRLVVKYYVGIKMKCAV